MPLYGSNPIEPVPGLRIVYDDQDIVVVDKPVGVAAHAGARNPKSSVRDVFVMERRKSRARERPRSTTC